MICEENINLEGVKFIVETIKRDFAGKRIFVYGSGNRGRQIKDILSKCDILVTSFLDNKKSECILPDDYFNSYMSDEDVIIVATVNIEFHDEMLNDIKNHSFKGTIVSNYEFHFKYEMPYIKSISNNTYDIDFKSRITEWLDNYPSEVLFWKDEVATEGAVYWDYYKKRIAIKEFTCSRLNMVLSDGDIVLDVGCGLCSQYGKSIDNGEINLVGVDPFATFYNKINNKYYEENDIKERAKIEFGMFELLSYEFGENHADYILIDNAMDHCIDPVAALVECLKTLKIGGILSTCHHINEAYMTIYSDLHQWNIYADETGEFVIWNKDNYINVNDFLGECVDIEVVIDKTVTKEMPYGKVICNFVKKQDIPENLSFNTKRRSAYVMEAMMHKISELTGIL